MFHRITQLVSDHPWTYVVVTAVAAASWAVHVSLLGYLGGAQFGHSLWEPLLTGAGVASLVALGFEGARRVAHRRGHHLVEARR